MNVLKSESHFKYLHKMYQNQRNWNFIIGKNFVNGKKRKRKVLIHGMFKSVPHNNSRIINIGIFTVTEQVRMSPEESHKNA